MADIADDVMDQIEQRLNGTCDDVDTAAEEFGVASEDLLEAIGERGNIERCVTCSWWDELGLMGENEAGEPQCSDCG